LSESEICFSTAVELVRRIRAKQLSAREVMEAHLSRIERVNPELNAIVTLHADRALEGARAADERQARGEPLGPLHGLPIAHKDLVMTRGIRTTFGSPLFRNHVPAQDDLIVERLGAAGAVTIGKTNTPEFGAGSQTYNEVFGETRNPYDPAKTCGGSSGGAATALAAGMLPIADGSDMGGSLRNPGNFCNVVGLRPSVGRVPMHPTQRPWSELSVLGPMARTVRDAALMLSAIAGPDPRSPIAIAEPGSRFAVPLDRDLQGLRIAWSRDLGGLPVDPRVTATIEARRHVFESLGCLIEDAEPDFTDADEVFKVLRAWTFALAFGNAGDEVLAQLKETVVWNIEQGRGLSAQQVGQAEIRRAQIYHRVREFMRDYEFLILPVNQVPPFDVKQRYVTEIAGQRMETYIDWMKSCYYITVTGHPAISVPCGFTSEGLPVGVQIVGRHQDDLGVLQLAHAFEEATGFWKRRPGAVAAPPPRAPLDGGPG
jgi:amidase